MEERHEKHGHNGYSGQLRFKPTSSGPLGISPGLVCLSECSGVGKMNFPWLCFIALLPSAVSICPEVCTAAGGYYNGGQCTVDVNPSATRAAAQDINIAVIGPYTGVEIEDSNYLPGYRVNLHLTDSFCDEAQGTEATIEAFTVGPTKHAILGDSCSNACAAVSDAARLFKVLMVSPGCDAPDLSDRTRYPYFTRMTPSDRFKVTAIYEVGLGMLGKLSKVCGY
eukprot:s4349_g3.t1